MFERYTEKARRVIFFARYEASQFGSPYIESEHVLLGIVREDKPLTNRFLRAEVASIRKQVETQTTTRENTATSVDLPLSNESKRVLAYAGEEAERLAHKHIGTEHLLLGLLREEKCLPRGSWWNEPFDCARSVRNSPGGHTRRCMGKNGFLCAMN
jgi:ATP-dependent Clp protease ATP-binding subunit ClpC